jgi:hypothetical protein
MALAPSPAAAKQGYVHTCLFDTLAKADCERSYAATCAFETHCSLAITVVPTNPTLDEQATAHAHHELLQKVALRTPIVYFGFVFSVPANGRPMCALGLALERAMAIGPGTPAVALTTWQTPILYSAQPFVTGPLSVVTAYALKDRGSKPVYRALRYWVDVSLPADGKPYCKVLAHVRGDYKAVQMAQSALLATRPPTYKRITWTRREEVLPAATEVLAMVRAHVVSMLGPKAAVVVTKKTRVAFLIHT